MPASEQCTGPVAVWVGITAITFQAQQAAVQLVTGAAAAPVVSTVTVTVPVFFGWGEAAPEPEFLPEYENLMCDLRGTRKPHDKIFEGVDARVTASFTVFDENVLQAMKAPTGTGAPGTDGGLDIGTIMMAEKKAFQLWLVYPYAIKPFMVSANLRAGYHFLGAMIDGPVRRKQGTGGNKVMLSWYCGSPLVKTSSGVVYRSWDNDMTAVLGKPTNINR